jgi:hypothetical protein
MADSDTRSRSQRGNAANSSGDHSSAAHTDPSNHNMALGAEAILSASEPHSPVKGKGRGRRNGKGKFHQNLNRASPVPSDRASTLIGSDHDSLSADTLVMGRIAKGKGRGKLMPYVPFDVVPYDNGKGKAVALFDDGKGKNGKGKGRGRGKGKGKGNPLNPRYRDSALCSTSWVFCALGISPLCLLFSVQGPSRALLRERPLMPRLFGIV